jgi:DNA-binding transcriptional ArsR family regulator
MSPKVQRNTETSKGRGTFFSSYIRGEAAAHDIDDFVDTWHAGGTGMSLPDFLGFSQKEYALWVVRPDSLESLLKKKRRRQLASTTPQRKIQQAVDVIKLISDLTRLRILLLLEDGEKGVATLCTDLGQSQLSISHHLALLRHGLLIASRRQGKNNYYELTTTGRNAVKLVGNLLD